MKCTVFTRRLSLLSIAATVGVLAAMVGSTAQATLVWYDGFAIGDDDGAGPNYVAGNLAGQQGGSDAGSGVGFFDDAGGDPNPWLGVNNTDPADQDNVVAAGSLCAVRPEPARRRATRRVTSQPTAAATSRGSRAISTRRCSR